MQDIVVVPTQKLGLKHLRENSIVCSGYTTRHIYKIAKTLVVELKSLKVPNFDSLPTVLGRKDEEWLLIQVGETSVYFFVESLRKDFDIVDLWINPATKDETDFITRLARLAEDGKKF